MEKRNTKQAADTIKRIVLIGPESTGKTDLSAQLAAHYNTIWLPEYARNYILSLNRPYDHRDIEHIAEMQIKLEDTIEIKANHYFFLDTDLIITKIWFLHLYKSCPQWVVSNIEEAKRDLYLLCDADIPWIADNIRENGGEKRNYFFKLYEAELIKYNFPYRIIRGEGKERLNNSIKEIDTFFQGK